MTLTEQEIRDQALFDRIAASYCAKDLSRSSRGARQLRLQQTMRGLVADGNISLLEVGCGAGFTVPYIQGKFRRYVGVDYSGELIAYARSNHGGPGVRFEAMTINEFKTDLRFDVVLLIGVLHHLDDLQATLGVLRGLLKPGGSLVANEPHPANPAIHLARLLRKRADSKYSSEQKELTGPELRRSLEQAGFVGVCLRPQGLFSTPFAEVSLKPESVWAPVARVACALDRLLEASLGGLLYPLSWNLIVSGQRPQDA